MSQLTFAGSPREPGVNILAQLHAQPGNKLSSILLPISEHELGRWLQVNHWEVVSTQLSDGYKVSSQWRGWRGFFTNLKNSLTSHCNNQDKGGRQKFLHPADNSYKDTLSVKGENFTTTKSRNQVSCYHLGCLTCNIRTGQVRSNGTSWAILWHSPFCSSCQH